MRMDPMRTLVMCVLVAALLAPIGVGAQAEVTANAGFLSEYFYRGIYQNTSVANGGFDVATDMFSAGTWAADVGAGAEVDLYAGVSIPLGESGSVSLGGTGYFYTHDFDNTYLEGNVGLAFGAISIDGAYGSYRIDPDATSYAFLSVSAEAPNGLFATLGALAFDGPAGGPLENLFDNDVASQYLEAGYGFTAAELDFSISGLWQNSAAASLNPTFADADNLALVFAVSRSFVIPTT
jgi:uncharacterized protein (TIGR02001 family)